MAGWRTHAAFCHAYATRDSPSYFSRPRPCTVAGLEMLQEVLHPYIFSGFIPRGRP